MTLFQSILTNQNRAFFFHCPKNLSCWNKKKSGCSLVWASQLTSHLKIPQNINTFVCFSTNHLQHITRLRIHSKVIHSIIIICWEWAGCGGPGGDNLNNGQVRNWNYTCQSPSGCQCVLFYFFNVELAMVYFLYSLSHTMVYITMS